MPKVKCYLTADARGNVTVNLPEFVGPILAETLPDGRLAAVVDVPDRILGPDGKPSEARVRTVYRGHETWDKPGCVAGVAVVE